MWIIKDALRALSSAMTSTLAWIVFAPLALLWPRDKKLVLVIGREKGLFLDNCKYFFIEGIRRKVPPRLLKFYTGDHATRSRLHAWRKHVVFSTSFRAISTLLRAGIVIIDSAEWVRGGKYQLTLGAKLVQLWHGAPLKEIELPLHQKRVKRQGIVFGFFYHLLKTISARYPKVDIFVSCSPFFTENAFSLQFEAAEIVEAGFPRNDVLFYSGQETGAETGLLNINVQQDVVDRISAAREAGMRILLYAPTFRKEKDDPFNSGILNLARLNQFCRTNGICIIFKLHPLMKDRYTMDAYEQLIHYEPHGDIYPVMRHTDLLITDYSSIYFDYLLLDKPVVFFPYDFESYIQDDRELLFEYDEMAPGPKCFDQDCLEQTIISELEQTDRHAAHRQKIREKTFLYTDGNSAHRVWEIIENLH